MTLETYCTVEHGHAQSLHERQILLTMSTQVRRRQSGSMGGAVSEQARAPRSAPMKPRPKVPQVSKRPSRHSTLVRKSTMSLSVKFCSAAMPPTEQRLNWLEQAELSYMRWRCPHTPTDG